MSIPNAYARAQRRVAGLPLCWVPEYLPDGRVIGWLVNLELFVGWVI